MRDPIQIWDDLLHEIADQAAEDSVATEADLQGARTVAAVVKARLGALPRPRTPVVIRVRRGVKILPEVQALPPEAVRVHLEQMCAQGDVWYAHQDLTGLSDHDLRTLLTLALEPKQR